MKTILAMIGLLMTQPNFNFQKVIDNKELFCLAKTVYHESRGEPIEGQVAVAHVVLNRIESEKYPDKICQVVYQPHQFTDIKKVKIKYDSKEWERAVEVSAFSMLGYVDDPTNGALYYYAHRKVKRPHWAKNFKVAEKIGDHTFLRKSS